MSQNIQYQYCSKCGALMSGGICPSCATNMNPNYNMYAMQPKKKMSTGAIVAIVLGSVGAFVLLVFVLVFLIFALTGGIIGASFLAIDEMNSSDRTSYYDTEVDLDYDSDDSNLVENDEDTDEDLDTDSTTIENNDLNEDDLIDIDGDGIGELFYEPGLEGLSGEYYASITDYIRYDLAYTVEYKEYKDDAGETIAYYPYVTGEEEFMNFINSVFYLTVQSAEEVGETLQCDASSIPYITYMDEEILSVIFAETYIFEDNTYYEDVICYNFDMKTGENLQFEWDTTDEFMSILGTRCMEQFGDDANYIFETYTSDELRELLETEEASMVEYFTPFGMELGISCEGYWCCATFKDYDQYISSQDIATEF